ncbi:hypothetical protein PhCBS80983_g06536, partial [Powellomyces hirtus]
STTLKASSTIYPDTLRPTVSLVKKPGGGLRFVTDYRELNEHTIADKYPLPREEHKHYTAFSTPHGLFEYNKLPFKLKNSPLTFQHVMGAVMAGLKYQSRLVYVDNLIMYSDTFEEHSEQNFLSKIVNGHGVAVDPVKVKVIQAINVHQGVPDVQTFMEEQQVFDQQKMAIQEAAILKFPKKDVPMVVSVDASKRGLGAALYKVKDNARILMAFLRKSLTDPETRYSNTEREGLAVVWAIQTLDSYLWGNNFMVESDHSPLLPLRKKGELFGKWASWSYALADYTFNMVHKAGKSPPHCTPDFLSRLHNYPPQSCTIAAQTGDSNSPNVQKLANDIPQRQQMDADFALIHRYLVEGALDGTKEQQESIRRMAHWLIVLNGTLYHVHWFNKTGFSGHLGRDRTLQKVQESYWWPGWHSDVVNQSCAGCSEHKPLPKNRVGPLTPIVVNDPWEKTGINIVGKLPTTARGNNYIVVLTYNMTNGWKHLLFPTSPPTVCQDD